MCRSILRQSKALCAALPRSLAESAVSLLIDDWRFAEVIYRVAPAAGSWNRVT